MKFCVPLINMPFEVALDIATSNNCRASFFEFWPLLLSNTPDNFYELIGERLGARAIINCRSTSGELMSNEALLNVSASALRYKYLIDLDFTLQNKSISLIPKDNLLLSFHDFNGDSLSGLVDISKSMNESTPRILKIACYARNENDVQQLLSLKLNLNNLKQANIVIGLGKIGRKARIVNDLLGNEITYAALNTESKNAPGQLSLDEYRSILKIFDRNI